MNEPGHVICAVVLLKLQGLDDGVHHVQQPGGDKVGQDTINYNIIMYYTRLFIFCLTKNMA